MQFLSLTVYLRLGTNSPGTNIIWLFSRIAINTTSFLEAFNSDLTWRSTQATLKFIRIVAVYFSTVVLWKRYFPARWNWITFFMGRDTVPNIRSANAILTTGNKFFLRRFLFTAKRTIVNKFSTATSTASSAKAEQNTMPVTLKEAFVAGQDPFLGEVVFSELGSIHLIWGHELRIRFRRGNKIFIAAEHEEKFLALGETEFQCSCSFRNRDYKRTA